MKNFDMLYGNGLLLLLVILEALFIKFKLKKEIPTKELVMNLNSGHILLWVFRSLEVSAYTFTFSYFSIGIIAPFPKFLIWIFSFILWDFLFYWLHRTHHLWRFLWNIHVVHHEGEHFSLSLGIRNSWYSSLSSFPYFVVMALIGIPPDIFITVSSLHYFLQFYNHNHLVKNSGWLEKFMITPAHHKVHHAKNNPYIDKNFGGTFVIWDKLFRTFKAEDPTNPVEVGVANPVKSYNPILVNNIPFINSLKWKFVFKSEKKSIELPNLILFTGAITLFSMLLSFIFFQHYLSNFHTFFLFLTVFVGTIANGLIMDGKLVGILLWILSNIIAPIYVFYSFPTTYFLFQMVVLLYLIHGILTLFYIIHTRNEKHNSYT